MSDYFCDWIQFTIHDEINRASEALKIFESVVRVGIEECKESKGFNGYEKMLQMNDGMKVMFSGMEGMGVNIIVPAGAIDCGKYEGSVEDIEDRLIDEGYKYNWTRLDLAVDTEEYDFDMFYEKFINKEYRCKYHAESIRQHVNANSRGTLYFGKRGGLTMLRIYDKALEQKIKDKVWTRIELETRNEACQQVLEAYKNGTINEYFLGHVEMVEKREKRMSRCKTADFYLEVLKGDGLKRKVQRKPSDSTLDWFVTQVAPTVKALEKDFGKEMVRNVIDNSKISHTQMRKRFHMKVIKNEVEKTEIVI